MDGVSSTTFGNYVVKRARGSREYARMQYRYFRDELTRHQLKAHQACGGCHELLRVLATLTEMWGTPSNFPESDGDDVAQDVRR